jgi:hypothetical protein
MNLGCQYITIFSPSAMLLWFKNYCSSIVIQLSFKGLQKLLQGGGGGGGGGGGQLPFHRLSSQLQDEHYFLTATYQMLIWF